MSRLIDLFAVLAVAVVVLLPKASVTARPAFDQTTGEPVELDRVSTLQDDVLRHTDQADIDWGVRERAKRAGAA